MTVLSGAQRKHLRGLAHHLRPAVQVGREGLTDAVLRSVEAALDSGELIKVQIAAERAERDEAAARIARDTASECVGQVGRIAIFYRQHADPERRRITLPG